MHAVQVRPGSPARHGRSLVFSAAVLAGLGALVFGGGLLALGGPAGASTVDSAAPVIRLIAAGQNAPSVTDADGNVWLPDTSYAVGGTVWTSGDQIANTASPALFQAERWGLSAYHIPVAAAGTYQVTLNEAETTWHAAGSRVFDVTAEGSTVLSQLDIYAQVGRDAADSVTFDVPVDDGVLDLGFSNDVDEAKVDSLSVQLISASASSSASAAPTVAPTVAPSTAPPVPVVPSASAVAAPPVIRLIAGTRSVTDAAGLLWSPDSADAVGGTVWNPGSPIANTSTPALFQTERWGLSGYHIPVATPGTYLVTLNEAETTWHAAGSRVFDVTAEGSTVISGLDIFAQVGGNIADSITFDVPVTDGELDLGFVNHADQAKVDSLSVQFVSAASPSSSAPVVVPSPTVTPSILPSATPTPSIVPTATPTPVVTPTAVPTVSAAGSVVTPEQYGAVGNGVTDDTAALQRTFDAWKPGTTIVLPAGKVFAHSGVLHLRVAGMHLSGPGTLLATAEATSAVWIEANNVLVDGGLTFKMGTTTQRWSAWEQMKVRIMGTTGVTLSNITVNGSAAAGIYVGGANDFTLDHVTVENTRADGIHMTGGSTNGRVISPIVENTGDDGIAVVSYGTDAKPCSNISVTNPTVLTTTWGRGMSVVGGTNIAYSNVDIENSDAAAIYIGSEGAPWNTYAAQHVTVTGGKIVNANTDATVDHGAVLVLSGETAVSPSDITISGLSILNTRVTASRDIGVINYGTAPTGIRFQNIVITGGPKSGYQGNAPLASFTLTAVSHNGVAVAN